MGVAEPFGLDTRTGAPSKDDCDLEELENHFRTDGWHLRLRREPFSHRGISNSADSFSFARTVGDFECGFMTDAEQVIFAKENPIHDKSLPANPILPGTGAQLGLLWRKAAKIAWNNTVLTEGTEEEFHGIPLSQEDGTRQIEFFLRSMAAVKWHKHPHFKFLEAVLLRAGEIAAHPNYNWCVQACGGNGIDMLPQYNWHLPALIMAVAGGPCPARVEYALERKDVASLLLNFGDSFRIQCDAEPSDSFVKPLAVRMAMALQSIADDSRASGNLAGRILATGFHLSSLWDVCGASPDFTHNLLHPSSSEEYLCKLGTRDPRVESIGIPMANEVALSLKRFEAAHGIKVSASLSVVDQDGCICYGTPSEKVAPFLTAFLTAASQIKNQPADGELCIDESMVDETGFYRGPDLSDYRGNLVVAVPCHYPGMRKIRISGDLTLRDGNGGRHLGAEETGTIFSCDGDLEVEGVITSIGDLGVGAERFCLLSAASIHCAGDIKLVTANIKATEGGITAARIDCDVMISHGEIRSEGSIYAGRISVGTGLVAKEVHCDSLEGHGVVRVAGELRSMHGVTICGPVSAESVVVLNPQRSGEAGSLKTSVLCTRLRTKKLVPAGIYRSWEGIHRPEAAGPAIRGEYGLSMRL